MSGSSRSTSKVLLSACLIGELVRYHGGHSLVSHPVLQRWIAEGRVVPFCPEVAGGLPTPRPPAEIVDTPVGRRVLTAAGADVTDAFARGADLAVGLCRAHGIRVAVLKESSPSCGGRTVYDGTFSGQRVSGQGLTAAALAAAGVRVFNEDEIDEAAAFLATLDPAR
jgi:uncharacterized protein YbbK (DUF523 family)